MKLNIQNIFKFVNEDEFYSSGKIAEEAAKSIYNMNTRNSEYLGWVELPTGTTDEDIHKINKTASRLRHLSKIIVVIGIGGSYLGSKAVIEALFPYFNNLMHYKNGYDKIPIKNLNENSDFTDNPIILFAGQNLSENYLADLLGFLKGEDYSIIVISKSGTTLEPALAFRILKEDLENRLGKINARERIVTITDKDKGALRRLAEVEGYDRFIIPDDIGGRYSVLTPVGLLPIACAGFNISEIIRGAANFQAIAKNSNDIISNPAYAYALARNKLYQSGKVIEILSNFTPSLHYFAEWWKQLFGESEGKNNRGIFPASVDLTTDLHSMGQWIQEGSRNIFETCLWVEKNDNRLTVPDSKNNLDGLNYLKGKNINFINQMAKEATLSAHVEGGVPVLEITLDELSEFELGRVIYFFELSCAISGLILGINPFNQPGVEAYKKKMFSLLGK